MTEQTSAPADTIEATPAAAEPAQEPAAAPDPTPAAPDLSEGGSGDDSASPHREAARYRTQLREAEAQRDALTQRLEAAHRREAEQLASGTLADPADLWGSTDLDALRDDESGDLDADRVQAAVEQLVQAKPHYRRPAVPRPDPTQGARSGTVEPKLGDIFKQRNRWAG